MPTGKKNLRPAAGAGNAPVKPEPPSSDVWDKLAAVEKETMAVRPPGSFTVTEYAERRGITRNEARTTVERMAQLGKVIKHKVPGSNLVFWSLA